MSWMARFRASIWMGLGVAGWPVSIGKEITGTAT
jgi:hypothetical protein